MNFFVFSMLLLVLASNLLLLFVGWEGVGLALRFVDRAFITPGQAAARAATKPLWSTVLAFWFYVRAVFNFVCLAQATLAEI